MSGRKQFTWDYWALRDEWIDRPADWEKLSGFEKREVFRGLFCQEATEGFDPNDKLHLMDRLSTCTETTFGAIFDEMPESDLAALIRMSRCRFDGTGEG